ncbi:MAG: hypothetical protein B9S37_08320 [Verrucomicrobiia bacterium Tous-C3TDCM]|nr:MAG: hypothetical protein B9S37_08320 [Verrucomicrobiae bacterium Tous-C3TDCM]
MHPKQEKFQARNHKNQNSASRRVDRRSSATQVCRANLLAQKSETIISPLAIDAVVSCEDFA